MIPGGCYTPEPDLLGVQTGALMVFRVASTQWEQDPMVGGLQKFPIDLAVRVAEGYGFEWDSDLQDWVLAAVEWYKKEFKRRVQKREDAKNRGQVSGRESPVNS